jgi:hypothetical protein
MLVKLAELTLTPPLPGGSMALVVALPMAVVSHFLLDRISNPYLYTSGRSSSYQYAAVSVNRSSNATPTVGETESEPLVGLRFTVKIESALADALDALPVTIRRNL